MKGKNKYSKRKKFDDESPISRHDSKKISKTNRKVLLQSRASAFRCVHCRQDIIVESDSTKHLNHCPNCLYSRHVDNKPGDRKSNCLGSMKPIGIALKIHGGDVAIIHECQECDVITMNRIAVEDDNEAIMTVFRDSLKIPENEIIRIEEMGINILQNQKMLEKALFGKGTE